MSVIEDQQVTYEAKLERRRYWFAAALIVVVVFSAVARNGLEVYLNGRVVRTVSGAGGQPAVLRMALLGSMALIALVVAITVLAHLRSALTSPFRLLLVLFPVAWFIVRDYVTVGGLSYTLVAGAGLIIAFWFVAAPYDVLKVMGVLAVGIAGLSLALGVFVPQFALVSNEVSLQKALFGDGLLAGPFTHQNSLALFLIGAGPFVFLLKRKMLWFTVIAVALVWSSSRTALLAGGITLVIVLILSAVSRKIQALLGGIAILAAIGVMAYLPAVTTDPEAFTGRGQIWSMSFYYLAGEWLAGLSPSWYNVVVPTQIGIFNTAAFHGHNDIVTMLVRGGIVALVAVALAWWFAWRQAVKSQSLPMLVIIGFFIIVAVAGVAETVWRPEADNPMFAIAIAPICILLFGVDRIVKERVAEDGEREGDPGFVGAP